MDTAPVKALFQPHSSPSLLGSTAARDVLAQWLSNLRAHVPGTKRGVKIVGAIGSGKSLLARLTLTEAGFQPVVFSASEARTPKQVREKLDRVAHEGNVRRAFGAAEDRPLAVVMDDLDALTASERSGISEIVALINPVRGKKSLTNADRAIMASHWSIPVVCICEERNDRRFAELDRDFLEVHLPKFSADEVTEACTRLDMLGCCLHIDPTLAEDIAGCCDGDYWRLRLMLTDAALTEEAAVVQDHRRQQDTKDIYKMTSSILFDRLTFHDCMRLHAVEQNLLPVMIHENCRDAIACCTVNDATKASAEREVVSALRLSDITERYMYNRQGLQLLRECSAALAIFSTNTAMRKLPMSRVDRPVTRFSNTLSKASTASMTGRHEDALISKAVSPDLRQESLLLIAALASKLPKPASSDLMNTYSLDAEAVRRLMRWRCHS